MLDRFHRSQGLNSQGPLHADLVGLDVPIEPRWQMSLSPTDSRCGRHPAGEPWRQSASSGIRRMRFLRLLFLACVCLPSPQRHVKRMIHMSYLEPLVSSKHAPLTYVQNVFSGWYRKLSRVRLFRAHHRFNYPVEIRIICASSITWVVCNILVLVRSVCVCKTLCTWSGIFRVWCARTHGAHGVPVDAITLAQPALA